MRMRTGFVLAVLAVAACNGSGSEDPTTSQASIATTATTSSSTTTTEPPTTAILSGTVTGLPAGDITCELVVQAFDLVIDGPVWEEALPCPSASAAGLDYSIEVAPGEYTIRMLARWGAGPPTLHNYVWYPGTQSHAAATPLTLTAGTERAWSAVMSPNVGQIQGSITDGTSGFEFGRTTPTGPDVLCAAVFETDGFYTGMWVDIGPAPEYSFDGVPTGSYQLLFYDCADDGSPIVEGNPLVVDRWFGAEPFGDIASTEVLTASYRAIAPYRSGAVAVDVTALATTDAPIAMHTVPTCLIQDVTMIGTREPDTFEFTDGVDVVITMGGDPAPAGLGPEDFLCDGAVDDPIATPVVDYCVQGGVFLRHGGATRHGAIGFLEDYQMVTGTGQVWIDPQNRPWFQIEWSEPDQPEYGWFAGWFAVEAPCPTPEWVLFKDGFGPAKTGDPKQEMLDWLVRALGPWEADINHSEIDPPCDQWNYYWFEYGLRVGFSVSDDTFINYLSMRSGGLTLELETDQGIKAGDPMATVSVQYPDAYTFVESGSGDQWLQSDHPDGLNSLRFIPEGGDPTTINFIKGGIYNSCNL